MRVNNYQRMVQLADKVFAVKNDPSQLDVNQDVVERLKKIHPSSVSEYSEENGPVAWVLLIPTTLDLMLQFLECKISERELFDLTPLNVRYDAVYLCSALVLEECRRKGIVKRLALEAIENMRATHPIESLFVWPFTPEGDFAAESIAQSVSLPLYKRTKHE